MTQASFNFDAPAARRDKQDAIKRVDDHANQEWRERMFETVRRIALTHREFTTDEPMEAYERNQQNPRTHEGRAMGAVMIRAAKAGIIRATDRMRNSIRRSCHNRKIQVWESLIFKGE